MRMRLFEVGLDPPYTEQSRRFAGCSGTGSHRLDTRAIPTVRRRVCHGLAYTHNTQAE